MTKSVDNLKPSNSDNKQKILLDKDVAAMTSNSEITFGKILSYTVICGSRRLNKNINRFLMYLASSVKRLSKSP